MIHFLLIESLISVNREDEIWVVWGLIGASYKIEKYALNYEPKAWYTLIGQRLCPTTGDNLLIPVGALLISGLMAGYKFDMGEFLSWNIWDKAMGREKLLLAYSCMITQLCFDVEV